jgi:hypothetical protein
MAQKDEPFSKAGFGFTPLAAGKIEAHVADWTRLAADSHVEEDLVTGGPQSYVFQN